MERGVVSVEMILNKGIKVFYALMVLIHMQLIARMMSYEWHEIAITVIATTNLILYLTLLVYAIKGKYYQTERVLLVLIVMTAIMYVTKVSYECIKYDDIAYILINSTLLHFLIEWVLVTRLLTIRRLERITIGGNRWKA